MKTIVQYTCASCEQEIIAPDGISFEFEVKRIYCSSACAKKGNLAEDLKDESGRPILSVRRMFSNISTSKK